MRQFLRVCVAVCGLGLAMLLASCATMSPEECKNAQWREVGQADGLVGASLSVFNSRVEDCAKADVVVDAEAYHQGRDLGLSSYCRMENAVQLGLNGSYYGRVCPPEVDGIFYQRHKVAFAVYAVRAEIHNLHIRTDVLESRLRESNRDEDSRLRSATSDTERSKIRRELDDERNKTRNELIEIDTQLRRKREELRHAEFNLSNLPAIR